MVRTRRLSGLEIRRIGRLTGSLVAAAVVMTILAPAAAADGIGPTNYRSQIDSVKPRSDAVTIKVVGSDAFLEVRAAAGSRVQIPGYDGEPYLRIDADGTVWQNRNSSATYLNTSRSGRAALPASLTEKSRPAWERIGSNSTAAWHDHRIHWMSSDAPSTGTDGLAARWEVPLSVDGTSLTVHGSLYHQSNLLPWPTLIAAALATLIVYLVVGRRRRLVTALLSAASILALTTTLLVRIGDPPQSGASPLAVILAGAALLAAVASMNPALKRPTYKLAAAIGSAALLIGWSIPLIGAFWMPYVPAAVPAAVIRVGTATVIGAVVGSLVSVVVDPSSLGGRRSKSGLSTLVDG